MSKKDKKNQDTHQENLAAEQQHGPASDAKTDKASPDASQPEATEEQKAEPSPEEKMVSLEAQLAEANDKYLRLFSEFDNFRKRSIKERIELTNSASAGIIVSLLPVLDDLERASKLLGETQDKDAAAEGIQLIYNKFKTLLAQKGVEEIKTIGEPFNTDFHDAITHIPSQDDQQKGKVVDEVQKGYILNGKVIRFARVVVAN
ncbi:MAG: nucleotide exchange factor GrpE [Bacteroidales bacterium]